MMMGAVCASIQVCGACVLSAKQEKTSSKGLFDEAGLNRN